MNTGLFSRVYFGRPQAGIGDLYVEVQGAYDYDNEYFGALAVFSADCFTRSHPAAA